MEINAPIFRLKRQAKLMARSENIALNKALDLVANREGFRSWSHLRASQGSSRSARAIISKLKPQDLLVLGARPGHGKTILGLELAVLAARENHQAYFFTLEDNLEKVLTRLEGLGVDYQSVHSNLIIDSSDEICAEYIEKVIAGRKARAFIVVDYLQLLDQRRSNPVLDSQLWHLKRLVESTGSILILISQIDRRFEQITRPIPIIEDIRMPNPIDLSAFTGSCFLHEGNIQLDMYD